MWINCCVDSKRKAESSAVQGGMKFRYLSVLDISIEIVSRSALPLPLLEVQSVCVLE